MVAAIPKAIQNGLLRRNLAALKCLEAVARHSSITKAAAELCVTPGAVSQQIRQLEETLGTELLVREHRRVSVAPDAEELAACLSQSFERIEQVLVDLTGEARSNTLRLRMLPSFAIRWLVPRLGSFYGAHPDIELEISTSPREEDISLERTDCSVRLGSGDWPNVESDRLFDDALVPVCTSEIARRLRKPEDVANLPLLHSMGRLEAWADWLAAQGLEGLVCKRNTRVANAALSCQGAVDGLGISIAQLSYVESDLAQGRLVMPFGDILYTGQAYYLVSSRPRARLPKTRTFRSWLLSSSRE